MFPRNGSSSLKRHIRLCTASLIKWIWNTMAKMCPGLYTSGRIFSWYSTVVWLSDYRFHLTYLLQCFQSLTMSQVQVNFKCFFPLQNLHGNLKPPILEKYIRYYWISNFIWINGVKYVYKKLWKDSHFSSQRNGTWQSWVVDLSHNQWPCKQTNKNSQEQSKLPKVFLLCPISQECIRNRPVWMTCR